MAESGWIHINDEYVTHLRNIHDIVSYGTPEMIKEFISVKKVDVDERGLRGMTPLHLAASYGETDKVEALLECGAKIDSTDDFGRTPLHHVAGKQVPSNAIQAIGSLFKVEISSYADCTEKLIERGADVNATDNDGWTPLHYSANHSSSKVTDVLIEKGARLDASDSMGMTPQDVAFAQGNKKMIERLEPAPIRNKTRGLEVEA